MNQTKVLEDLEARLPHKPHRFGPTDSVEHWESIGSPYTWVTAQKFEDVTLLDDIGHGWMALVVGDKVMDVGRDFVFAPERDIIGVSPSCGIGDWSTLFIGVRKKKEKK